MASSRSRRAVLAVLVLALPASAARGALWYEHYERGVEQARRGRCVEALADLDAAARLGPRAQQRIRTYGTSFLIDYDPQAWRARCLLALGRLAEAADALASAERAAVIAPGELAALRRELESRREAATRAAAGAARRPAGAPAMGATPGPDGAPGLAPPGLPPPASAAATAAPRPRAAPADGEGAIAAGGGETSAGGAEQRGADSEPAAEPPAAPPPVPAAAVAEAPAAPVGPPPPLPEPGRARPSPAGDGAPAIAASRAAEPRRTLPAAALLAAAVALGGGALLLRLARRRDAAAAAHAPRVGRYVLLEELGRGGMATTWRGRRTSDGLAVALKIPYLAADPTYAERFVREGRLGEALHHPNLVRILEAGQDGATPYLAMELLPGHTLRVELDANPGGLPVERALAVAIAIAEALDYAHGKGVVHRDLKPENVMLLPGGAVKVMDFGVARVEGQPGLTTSHVFFGSPLYAAPELVEPGGAGPRSDLYSLGVLLWEMLLGRVPFVHESVYRVLEMHQRSPLPEPASAGRALEPELSRILRTLLEKEPAARYPTAEALLVDLHRLAAERPAVPTAPATATS